MTTQDLYFFFNPYTGLVKIGVAADVPVRRRQIEHASGVRLETLAVFDGAWWYEQPLHEAFTAERQVGEWFVPTADIMGLVSQRETFDALLTRYANRIAEYRRTANEREVEDKARRREEREREKERLADVRAEERRIKREEAEKRATAKRKREAREARRLSEARESVEREQSEWAARGTALRERAERTAIVRGGAA